jgi:hypothetical protein
MSSFWGLPKRLGELFKEIQKCSLPSKSLLSEEEQYIPPYFSEDVETCETVENGKGGTEVVDVEIDVEGNVKFEAFLDGIQRTVLWRRVTLNNGAIVPIHIAHICAGIFLRGSDGRLSLEPEFIGSRLLLLGPFEGLKRAGVNIETFDKIESEIILDVDEKTFAFPSNFNEWIICDTTFRGTEKDRVENVVGALIEKNLFNESLVRSRAQSRVATLRQRLEMAVLAKFRERFPDKWILVDGPLYFLDKWRKPFYRALGHNEEFGDENSLESRVLKNAVGLIKTHKLRPKNPEQIINLNENQRSVVKRITKEVDIKGQGYAFDEDGSYAGAHFTWYTRLRTPRQQPYGLIGLVRLDIHKSTLGIKIVDALNNERFEEFRPQIDAITKAVWRERWPAIREGNDYYNASEPFPIYQLEKVLGASILPRRFLASFFDM